ncbi:MAG: class I SAM-dependent methyltransferase [Candidatus Omnitrophota bacterium]
MSIVDFEEVHKRRLLRRASYKKFGCDFEGERWFIIEKALPLEGRILEVGSGWGFFTTGLVERGYCVTGVDVNADDIAFAKWNMERMGLMAKVDLYAASGEKLPFPDRSFNAVFSVNVLHHLESPLKVVDEMIRVLAVEGKMIVSDFSEEGFSVAGKVHSDQGEVHQRLGVSIFEMKKYLVDKGLGVQHERTRCQETLIAYKGME